MAGVSAIAMRIIDRRNPIILDVRYILTALRTHDDVLVGILAGINRVDQRRLAGMLVGIMRVKALADHDQRRRKS